LILVDILSISSLWS